MSLIKRGKYWQYDFWYRNERFQGSTEQTNKNLARTLEAKIKSDLALANVGITPPKPSPTLKELLEGPFLQDVELHSVKPLTKTFHREKTRRLLAYETWRDIRIADIEEWINPYAQERLRGMKVGNQRLRPVGIGTVRCELSTLGKALNLAFDRGWLPKKIKVRLPPGAPSRDFIVLPELERAYLNRASYPLRQAAILLLDQGLRPEECLSLRKSDMTPQSLRVRAGKTKSARRELPLTARAAQTIELLFRLNPESEWLFPGRNGHYTRKSLEKQQLALTKTMGWPRPFVLYSLRHTFATRLAESGAGPYEIMKAMGHSRIEQALKYIHLSADFLTLAMTRKELHDRTMRGETAPADVPMGTRK